jgi:hypothetical protein
MLKKYKDFINKGSYNKALYLDDDWIIKMPLSKKEIDPDMEMYTEDILKKFKYHIDILSKYPKFFPKVKKLDKYRAAIEKLDTDTAKEELQYFVDYINAYIQGGNTIITILDFLVRSYKDSRIVLDKLKLVDDDDIIIKWYKFIMLIRNEFPIDNIDIHDENVGIDKDGNIKLLDF